MTPAPAHRAQAALQINAGACNISGIVHELARQVDAARAEGANLREDAALYLIIHQLAYLTGQESVCNPRWDTATGLCRGVLQRAAA